MAIQRNFPKDEAERIGSHKYFASYSYLPPMAFANNSVVRHFIWDWDDHLGKIQAYLGKHQRVFSGGQPRIRRFLPYLDYDNPTMVAVKADVRGVNYLGPRSDWEVVPDDPPVDPPNITATRPQMGSGNYYEQAHVTMEFANPRFMLGERLDADPFGSEGKTPSNEATRFCTKSVQRGIEFVTVKPGPFIWAGVPATNGANKINFPIAKVVSYESIVVYFWAVPYKAVPWRAIRECSGKVCNAILQLPEIPGREFYDPETVLFETYSAEEVRGPYPDFSISDPFADIYVHLAYHFKCRDTIFEGAPTETRQLHFNSVIHPGTGYPTRVYRDGSTEGIFQTADLSRLFKAE